MDGVLIVKKEKGYTSFDAIAVLRGILGTKKIGHTGTLDPEAEGVLPVCVGFATKLCDPLMVQKKEYIAHGRLGITTDTQDIYGQILAERPFDVSREQFEAALSGFHGPIRQLTPMYSARKIDGVKLVDLARRGITVERSEKTVNIYETELISFEPSTGEYVIRVLCQKGTYIRTICNDLGEKLGCGSCMTALTRTASGRFRIELGKTIDEIRTAMREQRIADLLIPIDALYLGSRPMDLSEEYRKYIANGNHLEPEWLTPMENDPVRDRFGVYENLLGEQEEKTIRVYMGGEFYAIYRKKGGHYVPLQMYHEVDNERNRMQKG